MPPCRQSIAICGCPYRSKGAVLALTLPEIRRKLVNIWLVKSRFDAEQKTGETQRRTHHLGRCACDVSQPRSRQRFCQ
jgi:hypothetical protein